MENKKLVFVNHSGQDTWVAKQISKEISSHKATPFLDEVDIDIGSEFEENILEFLDKANELVVLFTPWSLERLYVWAEIGAAWIRKIPMIVILYGLSPSEFQSNPNAPVFLKKRDIININDVGQYFDQLGRHTKENIIKGGRKMKNKIFLSNSFNDRAWAEQFVIALKKEGIDVRSNPELKVGENWREIIHSELRESNTLIVLLSSSSLNSPNIFFELGAAVAGNKRIIPIVIDDIGYEKLPLSMMKYQYLHESSPVSAAKVVVKAVQN